MRPDERGRTARAVFKPPLEDLEVALLGFHDVVEQGVDRGDLPVLVELVVEGGELRLVLEAEDLHQVVGPAAIFVDRAVGSPDAREQGLELAHEVEELAATPFTNGVGDGEQDARFAEVGHHEGPALGGSGVARRWSRAGGMERAGTMSTGRGGATCFVGRGDGSGRLRLRGTRERLPFRALSLSFSFSPARPGLVVREGLVARARLTGDFGRCFPREAGRFRAATLDRLRAGALELLRDTGLAVRRAFFVPLSSIRPPMRSLRVGLGVRMGHPELIYPEIVTRLRHIDPPFLEAAKKRRGSTATGIKSNKYNDLIIDPTNRIDRPACRLRVSKSLANPERPGVWHRP